MDPLTLTVSINCETPPTGWPRANYIVSKTALSIESHCWRQWAVTILDVIWLMKSTAACWGLLANGYTTRYDTIEELNVDSKAECDQLNLAHESKTNKRQCPLSSVSLQVPRTLSLVIRSSRSFISRGLLFDKHTAWCSGLICTCENSNASGQWQLHSCAAASPLRSATYISKHAGANQIATRLRRHCSGPACSRLLQSAGCSQPASQLV